MLRSGALRRLAALLPPRPPRLRRFSAASGDLPVIDVAPLVSPSSSLAQRRAVGAALDAACREVGFFNVVGHGVPTAVTDGALAAARSWFTETPDADKRALALSPRTGYRGYASLGKNVTKGARRCVPRCMRACSPHTVASGRAGQPDLHEGLDFYAEQAVGGPLRARNPWPTGDGGALAAASQAWVREGLRVGAALLRGIALGLQLPEHFFDDPATAGARARAGRAVPHSSIILCVACAHTPILAGDPYWVLRLIHYPPLPAGAQQASCGEHTDYGLLTLVLQEPHAAALQVRHAATGEWRTAPPMPGAFTCNIGDMLTVWTNGRYTSTLHRVMHTGGGRSRVSAPFFYEPSFAARVAPLPPFGPPRHAPVVYGQHLLSKVTTNFDTKDGMM
jgi:isopenicillin N synthase-like dioxygenase